MVLQQLQNYWNTLASSGDARSKDLPFVKEPTFVIIASIGYFLMVTYGPRFMATRNPLETRKAMIAYNAFSVAFSIWMMWEFIVCSFFNPDFTLLCHDLDENDTSAMSMRLVRAHWWYFFSKFIEFLDTLFFVVRKKNNQVSFLHVYHHLSMLSLQWCVVKYVPGGVSFLGPLVNCFIHALMYAYYMLAAFGPHMQKYLWWKRYLTRMQMIQFIALFIYLSNSLREGCKYWDGFAIVTLTYFASLFYLFNAFFNQSYRKVKGN